MKSSKTTEKLIVTVSPTGGIHGKEAHPGLPEQPDEIADAVFKCWNEGASIAHIHARDPVGRPTNDPDILRDIDRRIREKKCDIIIQHSTAADFVPRLPENKAIRAIEMNPEMASLSVTWPRVLSFRNEDRVTMLSMEEIVHSATTMRERGIKPELEVYSPVVMEEIHDMVDSGVVEKPCWINFVFGMRRVNRGYMDFSPQMLLHLISLFPDGSLFNVTGVGRMQLPATTMSVLVGGHVRVGFEDNIYYERGRLAESNAQLVARAARIGRELGCHIASPAEARDLLRIRQFTW